MSRGTAVLCSTTRARMERMAVAVPKFSKCARSCTHTRRTTRAADARAAHYTQTAALARMRAAAVRGSDRVRLLLAHRYAHACALLLEDQVRRSAQQTTVAP